MGLIKNILKSGKSIAYAGIAGLGILYTASLIGPDSQVQNLSSNNSSISQKSDLQKPTLETKVVSEAVAESAKDFWKLEGEVKYQGFKENDDGFPKTESYDRVVTNKLQVPYIDSHEVKIGGVGIFNPKKVKVGIFNEFSGYNIRVAFDLRFSFDAIIVAGKDSIFFSGTKRNSLGYIFTKGSRLFPDMTENHFFYVQSLSDNNHEGVSVNKIKDKSGKLQTLVQAYKDFYFVNGKYSYFFNKLGNPKIREEVVENEQTKGKIPYPLKFEVFPEEHYIEFKVDEKTGECKPIVYHNPNPKKRENEIYNEERMKEQKEEEVKSQEKTKFGVKTLDDILYFDFTSGEIPGFRVVNSNNHRVAQFSTVYNKENLDEALKKSKDFDAFVLIDTKNRAAYFSGGILGGSLYYMLSQNGMFAPDIKEDQVISIRPLSREKEKGIFVRRTDKELLIQPRSYFMITNSQYFSWRKPKDKTITIFEVTNLTGMQPYPMFIEICPGERHGVEFKMIGNECKPIAHNCPQKN